MNLDVLPPTDLGALRTLFAGVTAVLTLGNLPWFARTIDIKRSGLDAVSTPLDDDMENIGLDDLPGKESLLIRWLPVLSIPATMVVGVMFATVLLIATFDILPRTMLLAAIPLYLLFFSQAIDSSKVVRKTSLLPWTCLLLAIAPEDPGGQALSIVAIKILLVNMWFTAGLRKTWNGGWAWWEAKAGKVATIVLGKVVGQERKCTPFHCSTRFKVILRDKTAEEEEKDTPYPPEP